MVRMQHDTAFALATALLEIVQNCIRPEERKDAHNAFYSACKAALEIYEIKKAREESRLKPSRN